MDKQQLKECLKDMFRNGEIKIECEVKHSYVSEDLFTRVYIDGEEVYEFESFIKYK